MSPSTSSGPFHSSGRSFMELRREPKLRGHSPRADAAQLVSLKSPCSGGGGRLVCRSAGGVCSAVAGWAGVARAGSGLPASSASTSARVGKLGSAPNRDTAIAPAAAPNRMPSAIVRPSTSAMAKAARKASPAPVASIILPPGMGTASCSIRVPSARSRREPSAPRVTRTLAAPRACRLLAAAMTSARLPVGIEVSRFSSVSFGQMYVISLSRASGIGRSAPPAS
jgi:hypothetical protein